MKILSKILEYIASKMLQYITSIAGGLLIAFESSIPYFVPCIIATALDIWSAYCLGKRVHKKDPQLSDGKFKSAYKYRVMYTMIIALVVIILANYVDVNVLKETDVAVRAAVGFFLVYQSWSVLENWSSENNKPWALVLQRIMVNKAERHFNVPLSDILLNEEPKDKEKENERN